MALQVMGKIQVTKFKAAKLDSMLGMKVRIKGALYSASICHDHTDVLIDADEALPEHDLMVAHVFKATVGL